MTNKITLGNESLYPDHYDATLLEPIPRSDSRSRWLSKDASLPFTGVDIWTAYELSWLDKKGKPHVAIAEFTFPYNSRAIVESKSFKYYLNSFNQSTFSSNSTVIDTLTMDLSNVCGAPVSVDFLPPEQSSVIGVLSGICVDDIQANIKEYSPSPDLLEASENIVEQRQMHSHLLKSNCPVTGQPDWASIWVEYSGAEIDLESFLKYVVSFRRHQDFHENCVERIFSDIESHCKPSALSVYARYTRRGGLDINPFRSNCDRDLPFKRVIRQ